MLCTSQLTICSRKISYVPVYHGHFNSDEKVSFIFLSISTWMIYYVTISHISSLTICTDCFGNVHTIRVSSIGI